MTFTLPNENDALGNLKRSGLQQLGIGAIKLYQTKISTRTRARCKWSPTCSQYAIEAIEQFGLSTGLQVFYKRFKSCNSKYAGGPDPVLATPELSMASRTPIAETQADVGYDKVDAETSDHKLLIPDFDHRFRMILAYKPQSDFLSQDDFKLKIAQFNNYVLKIDQYDFRYKVSDVEVGSKTDKDGEPNYVVKLSGSTSKEYFENDVLELVKLMTTQLEVFILEAKQDNFRSIFFELDGQTIQEEKEDELFSDQFSGSIWDIFIPDYYDFYWDYYLIESLADLAADIAVGIFDAITEIPMDFDGFDSIDIGVDQVIDFGSAAPDISVPEAPDSGCDINPFDGDGCEVGGCDTDTNCDFNPFDGDGCDGCDTPDIDGCGDGCDGNELDGCLDGCDGDALSGCDLDGCDLGGCDFS